MNPERRRAPARFLQRGIPESKDLAFGVGVGSSVASDALQSATMFGRYFVYMVQSSSRRALYIGFTNCLIPRVIEHRTSRYPGSFTTKYRAWRLVYYEECGDAEMAKQRERQAQGLEPHKEERAGRQDES